MSECLVSQGYKNVLKHQMEPSHSRHTMAKWGDSLLPVTDLDHSDVAVHKDQRVCTFTVLCADGAGMLHMYF